MTVFGPVPSRRLGRSLGINTVPSGKVCTYSCIYCQIGPTPECRTARLAFCPAEEVAAEVGRILKELRSRNESVDYLTFVPDGEPTLDLDLGREIRALKPFGIPVAVLTNASLLWMPDVRADIEAADLVSVKVDTVDEAAWRKMSRPAADLDLPRVLDGIRAFTSGYRGRLVTESVLVKGVNDHTGQLKRVASFIATLRPTLAYVGYPTRPPAERWAARPARDVLAAARRAFEEAGVPVEVLGEEGELSFGFTGDAERDILAITSVHPMSRAQALELLAKAGEEAGVLDRLVAEGKLVAVEHAGTVFYRRKS